MKINKPLTAFILLVLAGIGALIANDQHEKSIVQDHERAVAHKQEEIRENATNRTIYFLEQGIIELEKKIGGIRQYYLLGSDEIPETLRAKMVKIFRNPKVQQEVQEGAEYALDKVLFYSLYADHLGGKMDNSQVQGAKFIRSSDTDEGKKWRNDAVQKRKEIMKSILADLDKANWLTWEKLSAEEPAPTKSY